MYHSFSSAGPSKFRRQILTSERFKWVKIESGNLLIGVKTPIDTRDNGAITLMSVTRQLTLANEGSRFIVKRKSLPQLGVLTL